MLKKKAVNKIQIST